MSLSFVITAAALLWPVFRRCLDLEPRTRPRPTTSSQAMGRRQPELTGYALKPYFVQEAVLSVLPEDEE